MHCSRECLIHCKSVKEVPNGTFPD
ncbi:hypothetical protein CEXT_339551, partial [Caerostris extrusa]